MADVIVSAIDAIQATHESVVSQRSITAPCLAEYPPTTDSARCPTILTHAETINFDTSFPNRSTISVVSRMLFKPLGQGHFGDTMYRIHQAMDDLRTHYSDEDRYAVVGRKLLQEAPYAVEVVSDFSMTGYEVIEYPLGFQLFYHGFEMRFTVETNSALEDCT